jgi:hypothetical protein
MHTCEPTGDSIGPGGWLRNIRTIVQYGCDARPGWYPDFGGVIQNDGTIDNAGTLPAESRASFPVPLPPRL